MSDNGKDKFTFGDLKRKFSPTWVELTPTEKTAAKFVLTEIVPEAFEFRRGANITSLVMSSAEGPHTDMDTVMAVAKQLHGALEKKLKEWESS
jgi:hypothetical protein